MPLVVLALAKNPVVKKYNLISLKHIGFGATLLRKELIEEFAESFPQVLLHRDIV